MLWSRLMSRVAVTGYMGPFFTEFNLNQELLSVEYPFTYAHELAHRLGIASEAEANLYAYLVTSAAQEPAIRFSGYFSGLCGKQCPEITYRRAVPGNCKTDPT